MNSIQTRIASIVEQYKERFAEEYGQFCEAMEDNREMQKDEFASTGSDGAIGQLLFEVPTTLHGMLTAKLASEEKKYYQSKLGAEWFAKTFREFSPAAKV